MALLKTVPTVAKPSPSARASVSSLAGKSPPSTKKTIDSPVKKPPPSPIKSKPIASMKSPAKVEKPPTETVKSPAKVDKSALKLTITKPGAGSTMKTPTSVKNPMTKSPAAEAKTPVRNVIKPMPKTPEPKQAGLKIDGRSSPEKLIGSKTVNSASSLKSNASVKSVASPVKSVSPAKSLPASKSVSSPVKSLSPVKSVSPVKSTSPVKSVTPVKSTSPVKSVSSPTKSISSVKPISSPAKSISSPLKSKPRDLKSSSAEFSKDTKTKASLISPIKKLAAVPKSPLKTIPSGKFDSPTKSKPTKASLTTSKAVKIKSMPTEIVSKPTEETGTAEVIDNSIPNVEKIDLCHCTDTTEKCQEFSPPLVTEYAVDNENFSVAQAFKVAEQLIKIQSNDRNLETIIETFENNSVVNWDDVITPCDDFAGTESNIEDAFVPLEPNDLGVPSSDESILKPDCCIIEMTDLNIPCNPEISTDPLDKLIDVQRDENRNIIKPIETSSDSSECTETQSNDEKYFSDDFSSASESIETESNDNFVTKYTDDLLPEWTITIDAFSLDLGSKENQSSNIYEITDEKENRIVEKPPCSVSMSYADVLKKIPNVLVNSTNVQGRKKPKLNVNLEIKQFRMLKKVEAALLNDIENNFLDYDDNYYFEEPEYCQTRKKKCKKIKHLSKRHFRNINREPEYVEQNEVIVASVWKNIY